MIYLFSGDYVRLDGVHLWDNVKVDDGCNISKSILCKNVHIKRYAATDSFNLDVFYNFLVKDARFSFVLLHELYSSRKGVSLSYLG